MSRTLHIQVEGIDKAIADIRAAELRRRGRVIQAVAKTALWGEREIKRMVTNPSPSRPLEPPGVDTGAYRASWRHSFHEMGLGADVYTESRIGPFLEFGTGVRGRGSNRQPLPAGYVHGTVPGMHARPHAGPLSERMRRQWIVNAKRAIAD